MRFDQVSDYINYFIGSLPDLFGAIDVEFHFFSDRPPIGDWSNLDQLGILIANDGIGSKSGLYFFASPNKEIAYIGKATKNNLHQRVWDHLKTPDVAANNWRTFPKHDFGSCTQATEEVEFIRNGEACLGLVTISDANLVSLIEVYLHTVHVKNFGRLPSLNKQIG